MGRWEDQDRARYRGPGRKGSRVKLARHVILIGFIVLAVVMTAFFVPRVGLSIDIHDRSEVVGTMQTVSVRITNNSFETMRSVTVQFGDGPVHNLGDFGPFQGRLITPDSDNLDFDTVTATANGGQIVTIKHRDHSAIVSGH